jgi:transcriptional repressor NrdR
MRCPKCKADDTKVIDSREAEEGLAIRRRRSCVACSHRYTTYERMEEVPLVVIKSHGARELFDRTKIVAGVRAATKGRPVTAAQVDGLAERVEDHARLNGREITSAELGREVLEQLRCLDEVAYVRFASVYKNFDAAADFHRELMLLEKLQSPS